MPLAAGRLRRAATRLEALASRSTVATRQESSDCRSAGAAGCFRRPAATIQESLNCRSGQARSRRSVRLGSLCEKRARRSTGRSQLRPPNPFWHHSAWTPTPRAMSVMSTMPVACADCRPRFDNLSEFLKSPEPSPDRIHGIVAARTGLPICPVCLLAAKFTWITTRLNRRLG